MGRRRRVHDAIGYAVVNGVRWVNFQRAALRAEAEQVARYERITARERLERAGKPVTGFGDPRNPTMFGSRFGPRYAVLPPAALAPLSVGQSDLLPFYFKVSTDARETVVAATEIENPHRLLVGRFDLAFVLVFLYPLLSLRSPTTCCRSRRSRARSRWRYPSRCRSVRSRRAKS